MQRLVAHAKSGAKLLAVGFASSLIGVLNKNPKGVLQCPLKTTPEHSTLTVCG
jgi:hypothetical protein